MIDPFDLNLRHLRALTEIARVGTLSAAADAVSISQPALTQGLTKLERILQATLFDRFAGGMRPTTAGDTLIARCKIALDLLERHAREAFRGAGRGFNRADRLMTGVQLRALVAVADAGSFVGAATAIRLSQPALHRAVRDLEQIGGSHLIERRGRGIALTANGRRLARGARLMASEIAAGLLELRGEAERLEVIRVGAMPLARARVLPIALARLVCEASCPTVRIIEGSWAELIEPLRDGVIDMMIGAMRDTVTPDIVQQPLFHDIVAVVGRSGHPLAESLPDLDDLARCDWVVAAPGTPIRAQWETLFEGRSLPAAPIECGSAMAISGVLARSDLLALLSPDQVAAELSAGILTRIGPPVVGATRTIGLITRADWWPTAGQRRFVAALEAAICQDD